LSEQVGPLTAGAAVYLVGGFLCLLRRARSRSQAADPLNRGRTYLLVCGSLFVFYPTAIYLAVGMAKDREQLLEIALVNYLWPSLTLLCSLPLLNKRGSLWLIPGTGLALGGLFLVVTQGAEVSWASFFEQLQSNPAAFGLALAGAIAWAFYSNLARGLSGSATGGGVDLFIPASGLLLLVLRLLTPEPTHWSFKAGGEACLLGAITAISYGLWEVAMRQGNLLLVVAFSYCTPLFSTLVSCAYLGVSATAKLWIGCLLLISGSLVTWSCVSEPPAGASDPERRRFGLPSERQRSGSVK
jgi:drug/metabolite transporter (DMT)-like permease